METVGTILSAIVSYAFAVAFYGIPMKVMFRKAGIVRTPTWLFFLPGPGTLALLWILAKRDWIPVVHGATREAGGAR